jgi:hypothetical protein
MPIGNAQLGDPSLSLIFFTAREMDHFVIWSRTKTRRQGRSGEVVLGSHDTRLSTRHPRQPPAPRPSLGSTAPEMDPIKSSQGTKSTSDDWELPEACRTSLEAARDVPGPPRLGTIRCWPRVPRCGPLGRSGAAQRLWAWGIGDGLLHVPRTLHLCTGNQCGIPFSVAARTSTAPYTRSSSTSSPLASPHSFVCPLLVSALTVPCSREKRRSSRRTPL